MGSIPGWGRSPGGGHGNPLQYFCLENPIEEPGGLQFTGCTESDTTEATSQRSQHCIIAERGKVSHLISYVVFVSINTLDLR